MSPALIAIIIVSSLVLAGLSYFVFKLGSKLSGRHGRSQRRSTLEDVVTVLDHVTVELSSLASDIHELERHEALLDYYESTLKVQEQLLLVMKQLVEDAITQQSLDSASYLAADLKERSGKLSAAFTSVKHTGSYDEVRLFGRTFAGQGRQACYFCSRPLGPRTLTKTVLKIAEKKKSVLTCPVCLIAIEEHGSAKILHFTEEGKQVHWSECKDFLPNQQYWNINRPQGSNKKPRLALIETKDSQKPD